MAKGYRRLPDAELVVMQALWDAERPMTRPELDEALAGEKQWAATTILNLLARLEGRGFVVRQRQGKGYLYSAAVPRAEYLEAESRSVLEQMFGGSARDFIAALHSSDALSAQDVEDLSAYLEKVRRGEV